MKSKNTSEPYGNKMRRRSFLKGTLAAGATTMIAPRILMAQAGKASPNERVNLACVGIGNRGEQVIRALHATGLANVVALCDTDMGAKHTRKTLKTFPEARRFQDFREMFDKMENQIDAVAVSTPDFSHFPVTIQAMALGKHVYVEKPLARTFRENELLIRAERKYKVATQMGNQGHSEANYYQFKAWVDAGIIRNVTKITAFMNNPRRWHGHTAASLLKEGDKPLPDTLDWDAWLATAADRAYNENYINGQWRCWYDFGMGALGDWGAHIFDTAHEFLDLGIPEEVNPVKIGGHADEIFPQASTLEFKFPKRRKMPPLVMTWYDGVDNLPPLPDTFGGAVVDANIPAPSAGTIDTKKAPPGKVIYGEDLTFKGGSHGSILEIIPASKAKDMESQLPEVPKSPSDHFANFLKAAKGEEKCNSPFSVSGALSQTMCLGVIAQWLNTPVKFDRKKKRITNDKRADALLDGPPPRKGWEEFYKL